MGRSRRLFVGTFPPPEVRRELHEAARGALEGTPARLVAADEIHLTLHFLGATDEARIPDLAAALDGAVRGGPVALAIRGAGGFPGVAGARVLWLGVAERTAGELARLAELARDVRTAAGSVGLPGETDEPWRAHLTVARASRGRLRLPDAFLGLALDVPWTPDEVVLVESCPGASGPDRFPVLSSIRLRSKPS